MPSNDWVKSRISLEILSLVPDFDFSNAEEDEDSFFIDSVCFYLRKFWICPKFSELWVSYSRKTPWGQIYEKKSKIKNVKDLSKVYSQKVELKNE